MTPRRSPRTRREPRLALSVQYAVTSTGLPVPATLRRWARAALERDASVTLRFVGGAEGRRLNATFRRKDYATNVLTFVYDDVANDGRDRLLTGDIVLCVPVIRREARERNRTLRAHCSHLVVHGMLHLQGYDHEDDAQAAAMESREQDVLKCLSYPNPYALA
ncbi:MAG TPA: rRNA maturation RNase YbeY [Casimicrobiaceae bacterium]|nr:rRNA maturation RNase YbeY [Casimicrobiaceae bacterium]